MPTLLCAALYGWTLLALFLQKDRRLPAILLVPAACFVAVTLLRRFINRQRPYDHFGLPPVGRYQPGKGKSMPSRHAASAAAIAIAVAVAFPSPIIQLCVGALCLLIAFLRVFTGHHYPSDVLAGVALSSALSLIGYPLLLQCLG